MSYRLFNQYIFYRKSITENQKKREHLSKQISTSYNTTDVRSCSYIKSAKYGGGKPNADMEGRQRGSQGNVI